MYKVLKDRGLGYGYEVWGTFEDKQKAFRFAKDNHRFNTPVNVELPCGKIVDPWFC